MAICGSPGLRRGGRHDQQFHPEQFSHLSRPAAEGFRDPARPLAFVPRVQRRPVRQCRRGVLGLRSGADLVAGRCGRRANGRGMELRDVRTVRLAQAMNLPSLESASLESASLAPTSLGPASLGPAGREPTMSPNEARLVRNTALAILALVALRLAAA